MSMEADSELHSITFGREQIEFRLKHSKRRTLGITVQPDAGVLVTAPRGAAVEVIKSKVRRRAVWIRRQQSFFQAFLPPVPGRRYVRGETHRYLGRQYRLKVIEAGDDAVKLKGRFLWVLTRHKGDAGHVRALVERWYAAHTRFAFERSLAECLGVLNGQVKTAPRLRVRRMPKRWGSCTKLGDIYLNPELIQAPRSCIDYVVTHELCHLIHPNHGREFYALLQKVMSDWKTRKERLERIWT